MMIDARALIDAAERETGLSDWGEPEWRDGLERLCASANREAGLDDGRAASLGAQIDKQLVKRLRLYADRAHYPEIAQQTIAAPIFVVGFPRSGTTILHGLLAADPRARSPLSWEVEAPSPPPQAGTAKHDPRIAATQARIDALPARFRAMHAAAADLPEEDNSIMQMAFRSLNFAASRPLPSYDRWLFACDMRPAFALHRHTLQHLQAFHARDWWVLKAPPHLFCLEDLFDTYPDARVIFTHRDPASIMASNASLISFIHEMAGNPVDTRALGQSETAKWRRGMERAMAFRAARPDLADRFHDCAFVDFVADPVGTVAALYARMDIELPDATRRIMEDFMAANRADKHGTHDYSAADFGLAPARVRAEFADYIDHFHVQCSG